ncbi:hypothetical protein [Bradyrhizobium yuanmingense]|uniref:hypothetical protein n=1 Tax=Bradyrhizobium yuanmingense TaxID=108015 RepID=UPI0035135416
MSRGTQRFKQQDLVRAVKGMMKAGVPIGRVEIGDGKLVIFAGQPDRQPEEISGNNEWDEVK